MFMSFYQSCEVGLDHMEIKHDHPVFSMLSLKVSERQGKVRTYFIRTSRNRSSKLGTDGHLGVRTGGRLTLAEVVFGLVQARQKERMREANGGYGLTPRTLQR